MVCRWFAYEITWASVLFTCGLSRYMREKASVQLRKCSPSELKGNIVGTQFSKGKPASDYSQHDVHMIFRGARSGVEGAPAPAPACCKHQGRLGFTQ